MIRFYPSPVFSMLGLLLVAARASAYQAVSFGEPLPVETLAPLLTLEPARHTGAHGSEIFSGHEVNDTDWKDASRVRSGSSIQDKPDILDTQQSPNLFQRSDEDDPWFRGTMQMNCLEAPEACQNACYYQNCIKGAAGSNNVVKYYDGGGNPAQTRINRVQSGITVGRGTPCKTWPFGQKFWDTFAFNPNPSMESEKYLETDEWPMAAMWNEPFKAKGPQPQHTLRCITGRSNGAGGRQLSQFRQNENRYQNVWKYYRRGSKLPFQASGAGKNWFYVNFNFDDFDDANPIHQSIKQSLTYCFAPFNQCKNDGRQFHMTQLVQNGDPDKAGGGYLSWPYDVTRQNAYKLDGEPGNIQQFHLTLEVTGDSRDQVAVSVGVYRKGKLVELAAMKKPLDFGTANSLLLQGDLPRPLIIERQRKGCGVFKFRYGNPSLDGHRVFAFGPEDEGIGAWAQKKGEKYSRARYCLEEDMTTVGKKKKVIGRRLKCSFPAW